MNKISKKVYTVLDTNTNKLIFKGSAEKIATMLNIDVENIYKAVCDHRKICKHYVIEKTNEVDIEKKTTKPKIEDEYRYLLKHLTEFGNAIIWINPERFRKRIKKEAAIDIIVEHYPERKIMLHDGRLNLGTYLDREHWIVKEKI